MHCACSVRDLETPVHLIQYSQSFDTRISTCLDCLDGVEQRRGKSVSLKYISMHLDRFNWS